MSTPNHGADQDGAGSRCVLLSWIARKNDPYDQDAPAGARRYGPTLMLLLDPASPYHNRCDSVVILYRQGDKDQQEHRSLAELQQILMREAPAIRIQTRAWRGDDSTDHRAIYDFLRREVPLIRADHPDRELIVHLSTGSPAMQTIWLLMVETGMIPEPVTLVQSYRQEDRRGRPLAVPVKLDLESFYKAYRGSRAATAPPGQAPLWDPGEIRSPRLRAVFTEAERYAGLRVPVLILGERGTGKTELAGWIRASSPFRKTKLDPHWPAVACGQYSPETLRGELFGYTKGAYTGATANHEGLIEHAHEDTLFLDELGDISRDLQRLLIKAIEEGRFQRLGETRVRESRFRLLSATNLPFDELRRRVDADFLDRISYLRLDLPPLRDLPEEIPRLWQRIYQLAQERAGHRGPALSNPDHQAIVTALQNHALPGNLRDLYRVAYRLLAAPGAGGEAVSYACHGILAERPATVDTVARAVARAFAETQSLDAALDLARGPLSIDGLEADLRAYLAHELGRLATARGTNIEALCDRTERTLRTWRQRQDPAADPAKDFRKLRGERRGRARRT